MKRKRKDNHLGRIGKVDKNQKARDEMKELKERARLEQIADLKEKVGDPFDSLDFVLTKRMAVWLYLSLLEELGEKSVIRNLGKPSDWRPPSKTRLFG